MQAEAATIVDQAIAWHLRVPDMAEHEWDEFLVWLEAVPAHRTAYDDVASADRMLALAARAMAPEPEASFEDWSEPARVVMSGWRRHGRLIGWGTSGIAACLAVVAAWSFMGARPSMTLEQTAPGTLKELAFAEGTRIQLNGDTAVQLDPRGSRQAELLRGEALFTVRHHQQPFVVDAGGYRIRDLGTVFNVRLGERTLDLAVKEGSVEFDPEGVALVVRAGEALTLDRANGVVVRRAATGVGGWVNGELVFTDTPLREVAGAIGRREGISIELSEGLSGQSFTGNIRLTGQGEADVAHLAALIGVAVRREGDKWLLGPRGADR